MHYKTSESTSTCYNQVIHDGDGEITRTPFFRDVLRLPFFCGMPTPDSDIFEIDSISEWSYTCAISGRCA